MVGSWGHVKRICCWFFKLFFSLLQAWRTLFLSSSMDSLSLHLCPINANQATTTFSKLLFCGIRLFNIGVLWLTIYEGEHLEVFLYLFVFVCLFHLNVEVISRAQKSFFTKIILWFFCNWKIVCTMWVWVGIMGPYNYPYLLCKNKGHVWTYVLHMTNLDIYL